MISDLLNNESFWIGTIVADLLWISAWLFLWYRDRNKPPVEERDLNEYVIREQLQGFLRNNRIVGSADIRDGWVFAPVPPERLEPLAIQFLNAWSVIANIGENTHNGYLAYYVNGNARLLELDVDSLREAYTVLSRLVEDRRKSRVLYRGFSENEIDMMVRMGMSAYFKDDGLFPESNAAASGLMDNRVEFLIAKEVLTLAIETSGRKHNEGFGPGRMA